MMQPNQSFSPAMFRHGRDSESYVVEQGDSASWLMTKLVKDMPGEQDQRPEPRTLRCRETDRVPLPNLQLDCSMVYESVVAVETTLLDSALDFSLDNGFLCPREMPEDQHHLKNPRTGSTASAHLLPDPHQVVDSMSSVLRHTGTKAPTSRSTEADNWQELQNSINLEQPLLTREVELESYKHRAEKFQSLAESLLEGKLSVQKNFEELSIIDDADYTKVESTPPVSSALSESTSRCTNASSYQIEGQNQYFIAAKDTGRYFLRRPVYKSRSMRHDKGELILSGNKTGADLSILNVLLEECNQTYPISLRSAISHFCDIERVSKLGEGTFGEVFKGNSCIFKIVPMGGETLVNGETQKTCAEIYSEVLLTKTLALLQGVESGAGVRSLNMSTNFIETKSTFICQGKYEEELIKAWEEWDGIRGSQNTHPMIFLPKQLYVVFVLADGGIDLESFVLLSHSEARSILLQIVLALATAEEACGFEHRDLHWLEGKYLKLKSSGVSVSIIDFTLSRINTGLCHSALMLPPAGKDVVFCNLSKDLNLFKGPKKDLQAETYRRMMKLTGGHWERSFPKTNCLWIHYVADILVNKKEFDITSKEKRSLRSFCKRALLYNSAKDASSDHFFDDLLLGQEIRELRGAPRQVGSRGLSHSRPEAGRQQSRPRPSDPHQGTHLGTA